MDNQNKKNELKIRILILLAIADKEFHEDEDKMIKSLLKKHNVNMQNYETIKNEILNSEDSFDNLCKDSLKKINNQDDQQDLLKIIFLLSMADLILHEDELRFIELCAVEWDIYGNSLKEMIKN